MIDYLSEIFHKIRQRDYTELLSSRIDFGNIGQRNQRAVTKLASGLIKLLFPNKIINDEELKLVLDKACELRQRVVDQLIIISPGEFKGTKIGYELK
jgi:ATP-dependent Lon protease